MVLLGSLVGRWLAAVGARKWSYGALDACLEDALQSTARVRGEYSLSEHSLAEDSLKEYSLSEVAEHPSPDSCWIVLWDLVFDVTDFVFEHPGSDLIILENAGTDATTVFTDVGHSRDAISMLTRYVIGILPKGERMYIRQTEE